MPAISFRAVLSAVALAAGLAGSAGSALAQNAPTLQEYPLSERIFGPGGAVFRDYVTPDQYGIAFYTGIGGKGSVFAAGTADFNCQQTQVPTIKVLSAPPGVQVLVGYGAFRATAIDGGVTTLCLGRQLKGLVVTTRGKAPRGSAITLRVTYPNLGAWYDHVVPLAR